MPFLQVDPGPTPGPEMHNAVRCSRFDHLMTGHLGLGCRVVGSGNAKGTSEALLFAQASHLQQVVGLVTPTPKFAM
jgi:hypothetical protein